MDNKFNVCLLNDSFPPVIDGVATTVLNYASIFQRKYGNAVVATPNYPGVVDDYPFQVCRYRSIDTVKYVGYRTGYPFSTAAIKKIKDANVSILHSHCPAVSSIFARTLRETIDAPIILTYHSKFDVDIRQDVELKILQTAGIKAFANNVSASDEVWVVSRGAGENLRDLGYEGEYRVMPNGVDYPKGRVSDEKCDELRKELGIGDEPVFLFVGRMLWYKNQKISIDGLAKIKALGKKFKAIFIGDGEDFNKIKKYVEDSKLSDDFIFTGAIRDRELLRVYFCISDLFLFPSTYDTNGLVVREAAACSVPSVTVKGACASEDTVDGVSGFIIDENSDAMAKILVYACENREALKKIGQNAADMLYLSWEDAVDMAYERYGIVLDEYRSGKLRHNHVPFDDIIGAVAEACIAMRKAKDTANNLNTKIKKTTRKIINETNDKRVLMSEASIEKRVVSKETKARNKTRRQKKRRKLKTAKRMVKNARLEAKKSKTESQK